MKYTLQETRAILDALRAAGLSTDDISQRLELWQVHANARAVRHWYSGKRNVKNVEYRALIHLLSEVNND